MKVITTEQVPIKMWLEDIEEGALEQAKNIANLPFIFKHFSVMPDSHQGYGMPIGGVLATKGVIIPNAVGVDIGCGMCAMATNLTYIDKSALQSIVDIIKEKIPVGFEHHQEQQDESLMPIWRDIDDKSYVVSEQYTNALKQIGTLGGGNHFIEIQQGSDGLIWVMIHSGSRNLGKRVADHYNNIAVSNNARWFSSVKKSDELAFLPIEEPQAKRYLKEMQYCVDFALANRNLMMERIKEAFAEIIPSVLFVAFKGNTITNIAHNYARWENHYGTNVLVHRKGATSAKEGEIGIIPGSMGTKSYIVEGLGNQESFMSCSHGAGRKMGRKQAQRELNLDAEMSIMDSQDIIHDMRSAENLDEASGAYKDIDVVMENQKDLVKILVELKPLAVIKG